MAAATSDFPRTSASFSSIRKKTVGFLSKHGAYYRDLSPDRWCDAMLREMDRGLAGKKSSLKMIPTYIEVDTGNEIPTERPVIVLDAGGTNFRSAILSFDHKRKPVIEHFSLCKMPGIDREVSRDEFFSTLAGYMRPVAGLSDIISFCFSYPAEILPNKDGRLITFTKEMKAPGVEGSLIGAGLREALAREGFADYSRLIILNDTVATLLAGRAVAEPGRYAGYIGFILGTGTNCAYIEQNQAISGIAPGKQGSQIINIESGGLTACPVSDFDDAFDATTNDRGAYRFEKMVAGRYLGPLALVMLKKAAAKGLFTKTGASSFDQLAMLETRDINDFLSNPGSKINTLAVSTENGDDRIICWHLLDLLIERAALLTAINLSAAVIKSGAGTNPLSPVCITAEGTTFYKLKGLQSKTESHLKAFLTGTKGRYTELVRVDDATLIGTAVAGFTN